MKTTKIFFLIIAFIGLLFVSCSDNTSSPISPTDQAKVGSSVTNLDKKGPIVHAVQGSYHIWFDGKHISQTISAHLYEDGSVDGTYLMNAQNALESKIQKWNGKVLFMKTYEDFGQYNGKMAVIGGLEMNGSYEGWYDIFFVIDNSPNGANEFSYYVWVTPDLAEAENIWNMDPEDLVAFLYGILPVDSGHLTIR